MTVQELIWGLSKFDPDMPVQICLDGEANPFVRGAFKDGSYVTLTNVETENFEDSAA